MGGKRALVILIASPSVESRLHSAEKLIFYLSILIFHCSHELFGVGIASAWVSSAYHSRSLASGHYCNRVILIPSHPDVGTVVLWITVTAK